MFSRRNSLSSLPARPRGKWDDSRVSNAVLKLEEELNSRNKWMVVIDGYDPETGHAEAGWGIIMPLNDARDTGLH